MPPPRALRSQANSILVAGHDTTSFCLTSTLYWVSRTPAVKAKLFAEIDRFGRDRVVKHDDMSSFPYLDVSTHLPWRAPHVSVRPVLQVK